MIDMNITARKLNISKYFKPQKCVIFMRHLLRLISISYQTTYMALYFDLCILATNWENKNVNDIN
jgi:hypothetical protein